MIATTLEQSKKLADIVSEVTKEKCYGCKWFIGDEYNHGCLNSRLCINYNEWEEKNYEDLCSIKNSVHQ